MCNPTRCVDVVVVLKAVHIPCSHSRVKLLSTAFCAGLLRLAYCKASGKRECYRSILPCYGAICILSCESVSPPGSSDKQALGTSIAWRGTETCPRSCYLPASAHAGWDICKEAPACRWHLAVMFFTGRSPVSWSHGLDNSAAAQCAPCDELQQLQEQLCPAQNVLSTCIPRQAVWSCDRPTPSAGSPVRHFRSSPCNALLSDLYRAWAPKSWKCMLSTQLSARAFVTSHAMPCFPRLLEASSGCLPFLPTCDCSAALLLAQLAGTAGMRVTCRSPSCRRRAHHTMRALPLVAMSCYKVR